METKKTYTPEQLASAAKMMDLLEALPEDRRFMTVMIANAFIAGMEAQERMITKERAAAQAQPDA